MNPTEREKLERQQAAAERAERDRLPPGDAGVDAFRLVLRAVKRPPAMQLPADFARQMAARVARTEETARIETWLTGLLLAAMIVAGTVFALPPLWRALATTTQVVSSQPVPWTLVLPAVIGLAAAVVFDRLIGPRRI